MKVASYDKPTNQQINCNCKQFGVENFFIKSWKELTDQNLIFCIEARNELLKDELIHNYELFMPMEPCTIVFGTNDGMKIGQEFLDAKKAGKFVLPITIPGKVLWAESAMAIILNEYARDDNKIYKS